MITEENPGKNLNQEIDPTGDRTRARCVRGNDVTPRRQRWSGLKETKLHENGGSYTMQSYVTCMGGSPGELSEELLTQEKRNKGWRMNCDVVEATEGLENEV